MILLNGVSGFNNSHKEVNGEDFKKTSYQLIQSSGGHVQFLKKPDATRNYYEMSVKYFNEDLSILLNATYPFIAFASSVAMDGIKFVNHNQLSDIFTPYYRILSTSELNEPLRMNNRKKNIGLENTNELNEAELSNIKYWKPNTVGDIVFNHWD